MTPATPPPTPTPTGTLTIAQCATLEALLIDLEKHTRASATLADEHRAAISSGDTAALARCIAAQQESAAQLNNLDARRAAFLRSLGLRPTATGGVTLSQIAAMAPKSRADALTAAAARIRELLADAAQRRETVRLASLSLMAHMQGIVRQITRNLSETKTYAPPNRLAAAGATAGNLDFTT